MFLEELKATEWLALGTGYKIGQPLSDIVVEGGVKYFLWEDNVGDSVESFVKVYCH